VPLYAKADVQVPCDAALSIEQMADRVIAALLTRGDVLEQLDA